jgi:hypothetical protein
LTLSAVSDGAPASVDLGPVSIKITCPAGTLLASAISEQDGAAKFGRANSEAATSGSSPFGDGSETFFSGGDDTVSLNPGTVLAAGTFVSRTGNSDSDSPRTISLDYLLHDPGSGDCTLDGNAIVTGP